MVYTIEHYTDQKNKVLYARENIIPQSFKWSVLYLGMGTCFLPRMQSENVTRTVIVENDERIIEINEYEKRIDESWEVIKWDAWAVDLDEEFDVIVADIFSTKQIEWVVDEFAKVYKKNLKKGWVMYFLPCVTNKWKVTIDDLWWYEEKIIEEDVE
jgi:predicted RNA methylase